MLWLHIICNRLQGYLNTLLSSSNGEIIESGLTIKYFVNQKDEKQKNIPLLEDLVMRFDGEHAIILLMYLKKG